MIVTHEDQRMTNHGTHDHEDRHDHDHDDRNADHDDQHHIVKAIDPRDEQDDATTPAEKENLEDGEDAELAAEEKIRQREELLEEKAV
jgi:hypothetical protein